MTERIHELKTAAFAFEAVKSGEKTFEVRRNDRGFQRGDLVVLRRLYPPPDEHYGIDTSEPSLTFRIGWMLQGGQFGIEPGFCVFSLDPVGGDAAS